MKYQFLFTIFVTTICAITANGLYRFGGVVAAVADGGVGIDVNTSLNSSEVLPPPTEDNNDGDDDDFVDDDDDDIDIDIDPDFNMPIYPGSGLIIDDTDIRDADRAIQEVEKLLQRFNNRIAFYKQRIQLVSDDDEKYVQKVISYGQSFNRFKRFHRRRNEPPKSQKNPHFYRQGDDATNVLMPAEIETSKEGADISDEEKFARTKRQLLKFYNKRIAHYEKRIKKISDDKKIKIHITEYGYPVKKENNKNKHKV